MQDFPPTVIFRHRKENLKKCSLRGLESREDFWFETYPRHSETSLNRPSLQNYILLAVDASPLSEKECGAGLFVIDATWRYAETMVQQLAPLVGNMTRRSIPSHYRTAYPRRQDHCSNPECGLATVEAIYIAYSLMGRETSGLLDNYYWKDSFLQKNNFD